jgi:hypothetical protein
MHCCILLDFSICIGALQSYVRSREVQEDGIFIELNHLMKVEALRSSETSVIMYQLLTKNHQTFHL